MDFELGPKELALQKEIREFAKREIPKDWIGNFLNEEGSDEDWEFSLSISKKLAQMGWLVMTWPKKYGGRDASYLEEAVFQMEAAYYSIPGLTMGISGTAWVGPSLMLYGSEEQRQKYLPMIASGSPDGIWCTGYSEPNAGSDFASIQTRAIRDGDDYIINGQKVWTSCAHRARWCWLAAKTDPNTDKPQRGISLFIVDMKSLDVTVKPLLNYAGTHIFNEVFFDNLRVPAENLVGVENRGWYQLMQALSFERRMVGSENYGLGTRIFDDLKEYVKKTKCLGKQMSEDPVTRRKLAEIAVELETLKIFALDLAWKMSQGIMPIYESSRNKAYADYVIEHLVEIGTEILGPFAQIDEHSRLARLNGIIQSEYLVFPGMASAAGTDEIEKGIIGQFKLGLPKAY